MMVLKEQLLILIVTQNIRPLQENLMQELELKQKKTSKAWEHLE